MRGSQTDAAHRRHAKLVTIVAAKMRRAKWELGAAAVLLPTLCWAQPPITEPVDRPIPLSEGEVVTTSQRADQRVNYAFEVTARGTHLIELQQHGLDFIVTVNDPSGESVSYNSPLHRDEREFVLLENAAAGEYVFTVHSEEYTGVVGHHDVQWTTLDSVADPRVIDAWSLMSRGAMANHEDGAQSLESAVAAYRQAAELWRELARERERAHALYSVGALEYESANWESSVEMARAASGLYSDLEQEALSAGANHRCAAALIEMATNVDEATPKTRQALFDEALGLFRQARRVHERLGNRYEIGLVINNIGLTHYLMGAFEQAKMFWQEALTLFQSLDEWEAELRSLGNQAVIHAEKSDLLDAIENFERIIDALPAGKLKTFRALILDNLAASHWLFGNLEDALRIYFNALTLHLENDDLRGEANSLRGIGQAYYGLGELDLATAYLERALPKVQEANHGRGHEAVVRYLGNIAFLKHDYGEALEYHETALKLATSPLDVAYLQVLMAKDLAALGQHAEAVPLAQQARGTAETSGARRLLANASQALGRAQSKLGNYPAAARNLEQARSIYASLQLRGKEADALNGLALMARDQGDLEAALQHGEASLDAVEDLRERIAHPELRALNAALRRTYYDTQIDLLMTRHRTSNAPGNRYLREALAVSERGRARMLLELFNETSVDLREGMDPALTARRNRLYEQLAERRSQRDALIDQSATEPQDKERLASVMNDLSTLENQLNLVETELRRANPRYASLSAPQTLAADEIQALLDPHSVLLQYALGDERSYVWAVTRNTIQAVELADRDTIENAARKAFDSLSTYRYNNEGRRQTNEALRELSSLILQPVADLLTENRILVASSGALHYIPFGVLPLPEADVSAMLEKYRIAAIPSLSGLAAQLRSRPSGDDAAAPPKTLAVFADPVLEASDPRFAEPPSLPPTQSKPRGLGTRSSSDSSLRRLIWTGQEADAIAELVPQEDQRLVATGFAATREAVLSRDLSQYRFLHFATHGRVDSRYPALSSLIMSQFDEHGAPQKNLRLHDIYNLRLNADLVVLSACDTALGREIRGESLIGFTQGFMYAGAHRVAASLWQVPDRATAELMTRFYRNMFAEGLRPAEALRQAQLSIASERRWSDPYFWGAFTLMGDWR